MKRAMAVKRTLAEVATEHDSTLVLPIPLDHEGAITISTGAGAAPRTDLVPNGDGA